MNLLLNGISSPAACVEIFEDSFKVFVEFKDLFKELAKLHDTNPSVEKIIEILKDLGYKDLRYKDITSRTR